MNRLFVLLAFSLPLSAQISYGLIAGIPFENLTTSGDKSGSYTIGPTLQIGLPLGLRVEADALYRPLGLNFTAQNFSAAQWRFPVLLQYRLPAPIVKPYVEAGYSYDHVNTFSITSHHGFVLGAGVDFKLLLIRVSPEIRYTRDVGAPANNLLQLNQAEFLVGLRF